MAEDDLDALQAYIDNPFDLTGPLVLGDEPFVAVWESYLTRSRTEGVFPVLQQALHQLRFPVRAGMQDEGAYREATRRGNLSGLAADGLFDGGVRLEAPERLRLELHPTPAGHLPILTAPVRADFETLVQALARRNEPAPLPPSMGALMVSGYNNWDRVRRYRERWEAAPADGETWAQAFAQLVPQKSLYQDRFVILSEGPYSGVPASELGLDAETWLSLSHAIRREHECAHYYCKRALGAMRYHVVDEVIADAYGLAVGTGCYRPDWLLRFLGIDGSEPLPREGGRMWNYCEGLPRETLGVLTIFLRRRISELTFGAAQDAPTRAHHLREFIGELLRTL